MRARDIKPGFYKNEQLAECSILARLVFPGLWMLADREGRFEYRPKRIKAELLPFDNADMVELLGDLEANGLIVVYEVGGSKYVWIPAFSRHQRPHTNEKASEIPPCEQELSSKEGTTRDLEEKDLSPRGKALRPSSLSPSSLTPEKETLTPFESSSPMSGGDLEMDQPKGESESQEHGKPSCPYWQIVEMYHAALPEHPRVKMLNASRQGAIRARWADVGKRLRNMGQTCETKDRLTWLQRYFTKAAQSPFLTGQVHQRDRPPYMTDFDFLMSPKGFAGVVEGKYDSREGA